MWGCPRLLRTAFRFVSRPIWSVRTCRIAVVGGAEDGAAGRFGCTRCGQGARCLTVTAAGRRAVLASMSAAILTLLWASTPNPHQVWAPSIASNRVRSQP